MEPDTNTVFKVSTGSETWTLYRLTAGGSSPDFVHVHTANHGTAEVENAQADVDRKLRWHRRDTSTSESASKIV